MLKFRSWIQQHRLYKYDLCKNPNYVQFMERDYELIDWDSLGMNENAIHLIERNLDKIENWFPISVNPHAIHILEKNMDKVVLTGLAMNTAARHLLINIEDILNVKTLYANPAMIDIILENQDKIDWEYLSINTAPQAIELLIQNPRKIW